MTKIERIYHENWHNFDGPPDVDAFKKAVNHPQFRRFDLDVESWDGNTEAVFISVDIERPETEEELKKRYEQNRANKISATKAAETRKRNNLERERQEYERLRKKFEK